MEDTTLLDRWVAEALNNERMPKMPEEEKAAMSLVRKSPKESVPSWGKCNAALARLAQTGNL